jgi:acyl dehydratase
MAEENATIEDLKKMVGVEGKTVSLEIEKGMVKMLAEAIGDANPLWQDEEQASRSKYGGIIAPPSLPLCSMVSGARSRTQPELPFPYPRKLDGGGEWEYYLPVKPGDIITSTGRLADVVERPGKTGKMAFITFEIIHRNQRGEVVAKTRTTTINLE